MLQQRAHSIEFPQRVMYSARGHVMQDRTECPSKAQSNAWVQQLQQCTLQTEKFSVIKFCCSKAQQCKNTFQIVTMHVTQTGHCRLSHASTVYFNSVWDPLGMHELWHIAKALQDFTCRQILQKTLASFAVWRTILECILLVWGPSWNAWVWQQLGTGLKMHRRLIKF